MFVQPVLSLSFPCIHGAAATRTHAHAPSHAHARLCLAVFVCCCCPFMLTPSDHIVTIFCRTLSEPQYCTYFSLCSDLGQRTLSCIFFISLPRITSLLSPSSFIDCIMDLKHLKEVNRILIVSLC